MTEEELNIIPPRWLSITQAMRYAPALGRKKIMTRIEQKDFDAYLDDGKWVIDRYSMDRHFMKDKKQRERAIEKGLAKLTGVM